jgi:hypothetical protein
MKRLAALFPIALALGPMTFVPGAGARAAPTLIAACQTINQPGSYVLANNLTAHGDCLVITADFVTIDLAGFLISGSGSTGTAILRSQGGRGISVRNGSISEFVTGVDLGSAGGSIVEGLRVFGISGLVVGNFGIIANGIVKDNVVAEFRGGGISATGTVTGNNVGGIRDIGISIGEGSTVIGNTAASFTIGISVSCPSNLIDNTAINSHGFNLFLNGEGCHIEDNLAP